MKLDSMGKRIGLLMILAGALLLFILFLLWLIMDFQGVSFIEAYGRPSYSARGYMDVLLHEWIGVSFVVFPLLLCGIILLLGYGESLISWIANGSKDKK